MKILVISDSCGGWNKQFIESTLSKINGCSIGFLCLTKVTEEWREYYSRFHVHIMEFPADIYENWLTGEKRAGKKILALMKGMRFFSGLNDYDILNYQFVSARMLPFFMCIWNARKKLIFSYWGSDLLRQGRKAGQAERLFLKYKGIAYATFDSLDLRDVFSVKYQSGRCRTMTAYFADPVLEAIRDMEQHGEDIYEIGGIRLPKDRVIVAVGYNGRKEQQHLRVLGQLSKLDTAYKDRLLVLLQMTYGAQEEYQRACVRKCEQNGIQAVLFDKYLSTRETAKIRMAADIFINSQTTDAFAGSFCEYLYAGTRVLNAVWLHYKEIDRFRLSCEEYGEFAKIPELMKKVMDSGGSQKGSRIARNREAVWNLRSERACRKRWEKVLSDVSGMQIHDGKF